MMQITKTVSICTHILVPGMTVNVRVLSALSVNSLYNDYSYCVTLVAAMRRKKQLKHGHFVSIHILIIYVFHCRSNLTVSMRNRIVGSI